MSEATFAIASTYAKEDMKMQYKIINGAVYYDGNMVLENIGIEINDNEKIAIVGRNGCGKTTLLKAIIGEIELEEGTGESEFQVIKTGNPYISYLRQMPFEDESISMVDEVRTVFKTLIDMEKKMKQLIDKMENQCDDKIINEYSDISERYMALGGLTYQKEYETMIRSMGFTEADDKKPISEFSGGQRTKIAFIKILLTKPDILLLDEPTNHLDIETIQWLESYLRSYKSTLVIISHDRMFLNRIVDKVYEIEWGETKCYKGNYSAFEEQKRENHIKQQKDYDLQQIEIERITRLIELFRYKPTKAKMVQSKIKLLQRMQILNAPDQYDTKTYMSKFQPRISSSRQVLSVSELVIGYDTPLAKVNFNLERGQKLGIVGSNGIGKSTLLKTLMDGASALSGDFKFGYNVEISYFDQQLAQISGDDTLFEIFQSEYPELNDTEVRTALGSFQFSGDDVFRPVSSLSGGEKVRLTLCKLLYKRTNVLILDEPTNHMDIIGKENLENILCSYKGTIIFVSHDRYFTNKIADRLLVFDKDGVEFVESTYGEYEKKRLNSEKPFNYINVEKKVEKNNTVKGDRNSIEKEKVKKEKRIEKLEVLINQYDEELERLNKIISQPNNSSDYIVLTELQKSIDEVKRCQGIYFNEWEQLMGELEVM